MSKATANVPQFDPTDTQSAIEGAEAQAAQDGTLQSPGDSRREDLAKKAERLITAANKLMEQLEIETADPTQLEIDNEVRAALNDVNEVYVSNALVNEFCYAWIYRDPHNEHGGRYVRKMQAIGWEVVQGDNVEAKEHRHVDGTRVVADCVLMRCRLDRKMLLDKRDRILRDAQQAGIVSRVFELAERAGTRAFDKLPGEIEQSLSAQSALRQRARGDFHRMNVGGKMDRMLRTGGIPGIPAPGAGR